MIKVGDKLPETTFRVMTTDGPKPRTTSEIFKGKRVVLIGMPGAFTPTCSMNHLPGYLKHANLIRSKGVDTIAVTTVNDAFVMGAWSKQNGADEDVIFLSDANTEFVRAIGLNFDGTERGIGPVRSKRYSMMVDDGVVKILHVEAETGKAEASGADNMMKML
jgi:peroxiredoxin